MPTLLLQIKMKKIPLFDDIDNVLPKIYKTYKKTEDEVNQDIDIVTIWLKMQPHLPERMERCHIRNFLFMNKFRVEKTKQKIDNYYTIRSLMPNMFNECNPKFSKMKKVLEETMYIGLHPKLYKGLYRVYLIKSRAGDVHMAKETLLTVSNINEIRFHEDYIFDDIHVIDLANLTFNDMIKYTPTLLVDLVKIYEKVYSFRFKAYYIMNAPPYVSKILQFLKSLVKPKIFERLHVSGDDAILRKIFTVDTLPKDYGGKGPSLEELTDIMVAKFDEYQSRFDQLDKMRVDESLRPEEPIDDEYLGYHGCFKKLTID